MISVVLPCRNEEEGIGICINKIKEVFRSNNIDGEIVVSDSSTDKSAEIARKLGAKVVKHNKTGYGNAILEGIDHAKGDVIVIGDADDTYDFLELPKLSSALKDNDMVIGRRKYIKKGAMPLLHRLIGNPLLSFFLRLFFHTKIKDTHCGFRLIRKKALDKLNLKTTGMEFASEMIVKAIKNRLKIKEVPLSYYPRKGRSKMKSFSDGWRHLRFMLTYAPVYLFLIPGLIFFVLGAIVMALFLSGPIKVFGITFYNRPMILGSFFTIVGYQIASLGIYTKIYMISIGFAKSDKLVDTIAKFITFESGILISFLIILFAGLLGWLVVSDWVMRGFPALTSNTLLFVLTLAIIGIQTMFSAFFLSILLIEKR